MGKGEMLVTKFIRPFFPRLFINTWFFQSGQVYVLLAFFYFFWWLLIYITIIIIISSTGWKAAELMSWRCFHRLSV